MSGSITLRSAQQDDEAFLFQVYAGTRTEELALVDWDDARKEAFLRMQFALQHRYYHERFADASFQVILRDGQPVGRLYVQRCPDRFVIVDMALLPEQRRAGIGSTLLRDLLAEADRAGVPVQIHVEQYNPALGLYERLGFVIRKRESIYFLMERPPGG